MVQFGAHLLASRVRGWEEWYVDYGALRAASRGGAVGSADAFARRWAAELARCEQHFGALSLGASRALLERRGVSALAARLCERLPGLSAAGNRGYAAGADTPEPGPASEAEALELQDQVLPLFDAARVFAQVNVEALRKLANKLGKHVSEEAALGLLCALSASQVAIAVHGGFGLQLREPVAAALQRACAPAAAPAPALALASAGGRESPFDALTRMVRRMDPALRRRLVSHRGFHSKSDDLSRPLENTREAYDQAWAAGLHLCECDVTLTVDGRVVLCHDADLSRLAQDPESDVSRRQVTELTFEQVNSLALKNGTRAPSLKQVLRSAVRNGPNAALVVEIKSGAEGQQVAAALCGLFGDNLPLLERVAVVMSFDLDILHTFNQYLRAALRDKVVERLPKVMFLTRNVYEEPLETEERTLYPYEMALDWAQPDRELRATVDGWMNRGLSRLDGVYMQYHDALLDGRARALVADLATTYCLGVWGAKTDPDSLATARDLVALGMAFVNTDLPEDMLTAPPK